MAAATTEVVTPADTAGSAFIKRRGKKIPDGRIVLRRVLVFSAVY
jgi:hypothetical protein